MSGPLLTQFVEDLKRAQAESIGKVTCPLETRSDLEPGFQPTIPGVSELNRWPNTWGQVNGVAPSDVGAALQRRGTLLAVRRSLLRLCLSVQGQSLCLRSM